MKPDSHPKSKARGVIFLVLFASCLLAPTNVFAQTAFTNDQTGNRTSQMGVTSTVPPTILAQPCTDLGQVGGTASFSVVAAGTGPFTYQWYENGTAISGATGSTLVLTNLQSGNFTNNTNGANSYDVTVSNGTTSVTSNMAALYLDTDGLGMPDWWQIQYFGAIGVDPNADSDGDGVSNLQEYLDGTDPTNANSHDFTLYVTGPIIVQPLQSRYFPATPVTLSTPLSPPLGSTGAYFQNWTGDAAGSVDPLNIQMTANKNIGIATASAITPPTAPILSAGGAGGSVNKVLLQSNGQILAAGGYHTLNGRPLWDLGRLNTNGTLDTTYFTGAGAVLPFNNQTGGASDMVQQTDEKVIVVGFFNSVLARSQVYSPTPSIYRINLDGTVDATFLASNPDFVAYYPNGADNPPEQGIITAVALQTDGKILIAGHFTYVGGVARNGIARLNTDGSLDTTFNPGTGFAQYENVLPSVSAQCLQVASNGQIYVGGYFDSYNGVSLPSIARLNADGSLDTTFAVGSGTSGSNPVVSSLLIRPGNGVIVGAHSGEFNGSAVPVLFALTNAGAVDSTFNISLTPSLYGIGVTALTFQPNGQILAGFGASLFRLNSNGSTDTTLSATFAGNQIDSIAVQSNGEIVVGGQFSSADGITQANIARLNSDGSLDTTAVMNAGAVLSSSETPTCLAEEADGKVLVGGNFTLLDNSSISYFARLNVDSTIDSTFNVGGTGPNQEVTAVIATAGHKIFVGGDFNSYNGSPVAGYIQLNMDGTIDPSFAVGSGYGDVQSEVQQGDGKYVVAGDFQNYSVYLERLNTDGTVDTTYSPQPDDEVLAEVLQPNGQLLIGGQFQNVNGQPQPYIARLNADGTTDTSFNAPSVSGNVTSLALEPNGQILYAVQNGALQRLNADGSADSTYAFPPGASSGVTALTVLSDGSALVGGTFALGNNQPTQYFVKLMPGGAIDPSLNPVFDAPPAAILALSNGEIYFGGPFNTNGAENAVGLVRLSASPFLVLGTVNFSVASPILTNTAETLTASASSTQGTITSLQFQVSTDNVNFTTIAQGTSSGNNQWAGQWTPTTPGTYFVRTFATDGLFNTGASVAISNFVVSQTAVAPQITKQPNSQTISLGGSASFSVQAIGTPTLTYQWYLNGGPINGQIGTTLSLTNVRQAQAGGYSVVVTNGGGSTSSITANLTVQASFSQWIAQYLTDPATDGLFDTPQNDGITNQLKYVYDISPSRPMTASDIASLPTAGTTTINGVQYLTMTYRQDSLLTGVTLNVQVSFDLNPNDWTTVEPTFTKIVSYDPVTGDPIVEVGVPTYTTYFIRLNVTSP
jgi:uncharacterized delta-60 repeat protein